MRISLLRWFKDIFFVTVLLATAGIACRAQTEPGSPPITQAIGYTVAPEANTPIYLKTLPNAVCKLREKLVDGERDDDDFDAEDAAADSAPQAGGGANRAAILNHLKLFSDGDGNARFFVQPPAETPVDEVNLVLRCAAGDARSRYVIRLRRSDRATRDLPFPPSVDPALNQSNQTVLPVLRDPETLTDQEIMLAGYPVRPDPIQSPNEYALWLSAVSKPINVVAPETTANDNIYHALMVSNIWTGDYTLPQTDSYGFAQPYVYVFGHWKTPKTVTGELFRSTATSEWVGLDGESPSPLVQAGTGQQTLPAGLVPVFLHQPPWTLSSYDAWTEVFPLQVSQELKTFPVHPGDNIECAVWISWDDMIPTQPGGFAYFQLTNLTTNQVVRTQFEIANLPNFDYKFNFLGRDAEWIVERPSYGPNPQNLTPFDLSNYHSQCVNNSASDFNALYIRSPVAWTETGPNQYIKQVFSSYSNNSVDMFAGLTFLSGMYMLDNYSMCFQWFNFR